MSTQRPKALAVSAGGAIALAALGAVALAGTSAMAESPAPQPDDTAPAGRSEALEHAVQIQAVSAEQVAGTFAFTQDEVADPSYIRRNLAQGSQVLCGAQCAADEEVPPASDWSLAVGGDVSNPFEATLTQIVAQDGGARLVMGCSCAGNPVDGRASANADVMGVSLAALIDRAGVEDTANTVVFGCADGYEVALPLSYVTQRFSLIAFELDGQPMANSMGGTCQLWMGSTAASYFARDVVSVAFETRDIPPARPGADFLTSTPSVSFTGSAA